LRGAEEAAQRQSMLSAWSALDGTQRFVWNKLITGAFRVGVSQQLLTRALAAVSGLDVQVVAHRLMGSWEPTPEFYRALIAPEEGAENASRPYPFFLASPLEGEPASLGAVGEWQAEWKWDGIRAQLIRRAGQVFLWSRGEELITERFPELAEMGELLPEGTVIDGEVLPWRDGGVLPFAQLQRRIGRKTLGKKLLAEVPVVLMTYDLLEAGGRDIRDLPLRQRRQMLEELAARVSSPQLLLSPLPILRTALITAIAVIAISTRRVAWQPSRSATVWWRCMIRQNRNWAEARSPSSCRSLAPTAITCRQPPP